MLAELHAHLRVGRNGVAGVSTSLFHQRNDGLLREHVSGYPTREAIDRVGAWSTPRLGDDLDPVGRDGLREVLHRRWRYALPPRVMHRAIVDERHV